MILFQGSNGTFHILVKGDGGMFDVTPFRGINEAPFLIRVKDSSKLDFEKISGMKEQLHNFFFVDSARMCCHEFSVSSLVRYNRTL